MAYVLLCLRMCVCVFVTGALVAWHMAALINACSLPARLVCSAAEMKPSWRGVAYKLGNNIVGVAVSMAYDDGRGLSSGNIACS